MSTPIKQIEVAVYLPDEQAKQFLEFQEYYDKIVVLIKSGALQVKNGSVVMHFDHLGTLKAVNRADFLYSHEHGYPHLR